MIAIIYDTCKDWYHFMEINENQLKVIAYFQDKGIINEKMDIKVIDGIEIIDVTDGKTIDLTKEKE